MNHIGIVTMLFAAVDVNSPEYRIGALIGMLIAGVGCGLWPLSAGLRKGQPVIGMVGFFACFISGFILGCVLALPVAIFFRLVIGVFNPPEPPDGNSLDDTPFNPYANGKRSAF